MAHARGNHHIYKHRNVRVSHVVSTISYIDYPNLQINICYTRLELLTIMWVQTTGAYIELDAEFIM